MSSFVARSLLVLSAPLCFGCYPDPLLYTDTDVVITFRDLGRGYSSLKTYSLPDEVLDLCQELPGSGGAAGEAGVAGDESNPNCYELDHQFDADILRAIQRNMDSLGFQQVPTEQSPDVVVVPGVSANDNWYLFYPWCNYYWPGYCYYYPWTPTAVNYPVGSLVMYMVAPNEADAAAEQLPVAWLGIVRGLISSSSDLDLSRLNANVNQAFAQSQYLGEGK